MTINSRLRNVVLAQSNSSTVLSHLLSTAYKVPTWRWYDSLDGGMTNACGNPKLWKSSEGNEQLLTSSSITPISTHPQQPSTRFRLDFQRLPPPISLPSSSAN